MLNEKEIIANELNGENDWMQISSATDLTIEDLKNYKHKLIWHEVIFSTRDIPNYLIDEMITTGKLETNWSVWGRISKYHADDIEFIKKYNDKLDFIEVTKRNKFKASDLAKIIKRPEVGMGATISYGSDSNPYTVIEVNKAGTRIKVQSDDFKPAEGFDYYSNQKYEYTPNPTGSIQEFSLRSNANWVQIKGSTKVYIGHRTRYSNPSF